jgi:hypothetical protein
MEWARAMWTAMQPFVQDGSYVNYPTEDEGAAKVRAAYGPNYDRLVAIKAKCAPTNSFSLN